MSTIYHYQVNNPTPCNHTITGDSHVVFYHMLDGISCGIDWIWFGIFFGVFTPCLVLLQYQIPDRDMSEYQKLIQ